MKYKKVKLELNYTENGLFLNAWDNENGNDICARCFGSDMFDVDGVKCSFDDILAMIELRDDIDG